MQPIPSQSVSLPNGVSLPRRLERLADLAYNLWWAWTSDAERIFKRLDPEGWETSAHNPVDLLRIVSRRRLNAVTHDRSFMDHYSRVIAALDEYLASATTWYARQYPDRLNQPIAYFSTEFGLHESLPIYAGGLGILSGDHLKEASDLGLPLVAVGFLYTEGYFRQHVTEDGWQEARYTTLAFKDLPVLPALDATGNRLTVNIELPGREISAQLWRVQVGRVPLFLLDADVESNQPSDRSLTSRLYISDLELRISQEIILGIGGVRALRALGYNPAVWHMNEGHSAFLALERIREMVAAGHGLQQAMERLRGSTIFTTHTPVPAGQDEFPLWLIDKYFGGYWPQLGLARDAFIDLARERHPWGENFSMPVLAIRASGQVNGVSELHGKTARAMWAHLWPGRTGDQIPIGHITNGVHTDTWLARRLKLLFDRYLGPDWRDHLEELAVWERIDNIPDEELWSIRRHLKRKLVHYMRERARLQWLEGDVHPVQVVASGSLLDPYALTIGFARRFATYKRANLILRDPDRLLDLLNRPGMPVQVIFAGKAHPADEPGKQLIQEVYRQIKRAETGGRLVFLEDYDMNLARYLLQGVDVWLNTPRRPNEASGTSGQKAALNGVLNFSVLDGWWREAYNGLNGWAIGEEEDLSDPAAQDEADAESLYETLEREIIPLYYATPLHDHFPVEWIHRIKESISTLAPQFSTRRMVKEYISEVYLPALPQPEAV
ncbi:MAG TPA: alpha-glucan family phosphorylase [Anaerolineales bacterium]|nr:alpha-glucan family phosphorylase [Anaerolineales bacterium]